MLLVSSACARRPIAPRAWSEGDVSAEHCLRSMQCEAVRGRQSSRSNTRAATLAFEHKHNTLSHRTCGGKGYPSSQYSMDVVDTVPMHVTRDRQKHHVCGLVMQAWVIALGQHSQEGPSALHRPSLFNMYCTVGYLSVGHAPQCACMHLKV
jgi:hypothetical protein